MYHLFNWKNSNVSVLSISPALGPDETLTTPLSFLLCIHIPGHHSEGSEESVKRITCSQGPSPSPSGSSEDPQELMYSSRDTVKVGPQVGIVARRLSFFICITPPGPELLKSIINQLLDYCEAQAKRRGGAFLRWKISQIF